MSILDSVRNLFNKDKKNAIGQRSSRLQRQFVNLKDAKSLVFIVNRAVLSGEDISVLREYIKSCKKHNQTVSVIEICRDSKAVCIFRQETNTIFIDKKGVNWLDFPIETIERQLLQVKADILINFDHSPRHTSHYVSGLIEAKTRAGFHIEGFEGFYEIMLSHNTPLPMRSLIPQFENFLKMV